MRVLISSSRWLLLLAVSFASVLAWQASAQAAVGATLTIHSRVCPSTEVPDNLFAECHDIAAGNLEFTATGPSGNLSGIADAAGNLTFSDLMPGTYVVNGGVGGDFARSFAFCSSDGGETGSLIALTPGVGVEAITLSGTETVCDWYAVPFDQRGDVDDPTPTAAPTTSTPARVLPATGTGAANDATPTAALLIAAVLALIAATGLRRRQDAT